jgi:hypothetical protein
MDRAIFRGQSHVDHERRRRPAEHSRQLLHPDPGRRAQAPHVRRDDRIHVRRFGLPPGTERGDELVAPGELEQHVRLPLLRQRGMRPSRVVVSGIDAEVTRQRREATVQRVVQGFRAAVLKVRAAGAADQQGVAGEERVADAQADGVVGVSRTREDFDLAAAESDAIAIA